MEEIEHSAFALMIFLMLVSTLVVGYNLYYEVVFRLRRKISYKTYTYFKPMYLCKINYINVGAIGFVLLFTLILFAMFIGSNVVRLYCVAFIPIDLIMFLFLYYEISRSQYNNINITNYDSYYRDLYKIERSKTQLLNKITKLQDEFTGLANELMGNFNKFNAILPNEAKEQEFKDYISACTAEFDENKRELSTYNTDVINAFNSALYDFLTSGIETDYEIPEFRTIDIKQMFSYVSNIRTMFESYVNDYSKIKLAQGAIKNADKIIQLIEIAKKFNTVFSEDEVLKILEMVSKKVDQKEKVALYLLSDNMLTEDILFETVVNRDWDWCLDEGYISSRNRKKITELYANIVEANAIKSCNKLLKINSFDQSDILMKVLNTATVSNACTQVIKFRIIIESGSQQFDNPATMYENMAVALRNYALSNPSYENKSWIIGVCKDESFYENAQEIEIAYKAVSTKLHSKYEYLNSVLLCFFEGDLAKNKYIDNTKIASLYLENMLTLNSASLKVFALLAASLILLMDENDANIAIAVDAIKNDSIGKEALAKTVTDVGAGQYILQNLFDTKLDKLIPIVNRCEKTRMSLDKLEELLK